VDLVMTSGFVLKNLNGNQFIEVCILCLSLIDKTIASVHSKILFRKKIRWMD
jgi:hypothetical protein